jgi:hypothetical protein
MRRSALFFLVTGLFLVASAGAALGTTADLALRSATANFSTAASGQRIVFRAVAKNLGPGTSQLDVTFSNATNFLPRREICIVPPSEAGEINTPSADGPSCEFANVPENDRVVVKVPGHVSGEPGQDAAITFCTSNETGMDDGNPANDCKSATVLIGET